MTAPVFIEQRGLSGLGVDFVPGQSYQSIIGEGYTPVPQEGRGQTAPEEPKPAPAVQVAQRATATSASTLFGLPRPLVYAGLVVAAVWAARRLTR